MDDGRPQPGQQCWDNVRVYEEPSSNFLVAKPLLAQCEESTKLVERVQGDALNIFGQRILLSQTALAHLARNGRRLGQALLLDQQFG